jgi:DNA-binding transcriptional LysR family regulator
MMLLSPALRYFEAVARAGSVQEAARRLNVAASAVNRQIIKLEEELGAPLFDRLHRGMRLTAAGEALVLEVRRWQADIHRTRQAIEAMKGLRRGHVTIAAMECFAAAVLPEALASFNERHPGVTVRLRVLGTAGCIEQLASGEADLALAFNMPERPSHELMHISSWPIGVVMHPAHPLAAQASLSLPECLAHPLALPDDTLMLRGTVDSLLGRIGVRSAPDYVSNSISAIKAIVAQGRSITFLTRLDIVEELARGTLVQRALEERAVVPDHLCLVAARERASRTLVRSLAGIIARRIDAFAGADAGG